MQVHEGHVNAVMSVHYGPTGREFVSGGYDNTIRIWNQRLLEKNSVLRCISFPGNLFR